MLENVLLQTPEVQEISFLSWMAIFIAAISASAVTGSFLLNWRISVKENNRKYVELVNTIQNQLNQIIGKKHEPKTVQEFMELLYQYLNKVEEIAYLVLKNKIPLDMAEYFVWWLKDGYSIITELDKKSIEDDIFHKETWKYLVDWREKRFPDTKNFYPENERPIFLIRLNYFLDNPKI